jgi:hypothetical protein
MQASNGSELSIPAGPSHAVLDHPRYAAELQGIMARLASLAAQASAGGAAEAHAAASHSSSSCAAPPAPLSPSGSLNVKVSGWLCAADASS